MSKVTLLVCYPHPKDIEAFNADYAAHIDLLHEQLKLPKKHPPYTITRFPNSLNEFSPYYQMFSLPFPSAEDMQTTLSSEGMKAVAADAARISTGGAPVMLIGVEPMKM